MHARLLRIVYNDNFSSFEDLLQRDQSVSIHHRKIRLFGIELHKTRHNIFSQIVKLSNFRSQTDFTTRPISTFNNGLKGLRYIVLKIWDIIHLMLETLETLKNLREKLRVGLLKIVLASYVLITSSTLGMSVSHAFGTIHSEVL